MDKHLLIKMPDGSVWMVLHRKMAEIIAEKQMATDLAQDAGVTRELLIQEFLDEQFAETVGSDQLQEWLKWAEIAPHAICVKQPNPPYGEWWEKQVDHWSDFAFVDEEGEKKLADQGWNITHTLDGTLQMGKKES